MTIMVPDMFTRRRSEVKDTRTIIAPLVADGAMGTELLRAGFSSDRPLERANLEYPQVVLAIHEEYRRAGADMITTNTFGANRSRLLASTYADRVSDLNQAGVKLARGVANDVLVAGSMGPTGVHEEEEDYDACRAVFREQAAALNDAGVDLFSCETFGDTRELRAAIAGIRDVSDRPILAHMTYLPNGRTPRGDTPADVVEALHDLQIVAIGVNCAVGDGTVQEVVAALRAATSLPIIARPNAGQPVRVGSCWQYPLGPDDFAELVCELSNHADIVGGCCGTTPQHIAAANKRLRSRAEM